MARVCVLPCVGLGALAGGLLTYSIVHLGEFKTFTELVLHVLWLVLEACC